MPLTARFDDASPGHGAAFELSGLEGTVVARRIDEVRAALDDVQGRVLGGLWAAGFVTYDAAPALTPGMAVRSRDPGEPLGHLPLVWFGLFRERVPVEPFEARTTHPAPYNVSVWTPTEDRAHYERSVDQFREHVIDGDVLQANYSTRLRAAFSGDAFEFYRDLVIAQRSGHCGYVDTGRYQVLSASPERFYQRTGDRVRTRPMKGTVRRGRWPDEDRHLARRLEASELERGEHEQVVRQFEADLEKVAQRGTVAVSRPYELERYETVWQLTSTVTAVVDPAKTCTDLFAALFPAASITGVPRQRTMELIADVETTSRGIYCGAVGYMGSLEGRSFSAFNVAIRTVVVDADEGMAEYGTGGGVSRSSASATEFEEARAKAQLLVDRRPQFDLLELVRWEPADGFWWPEEHLDRLEQSAEYFGFEWSRVAAQAALAEAAAGLAAPSLVTLSLRRDGRITAEVDALEGPSVVAYRGGPIEPEGPIRQLPRVLEIDDEPVWSNNVYLFHKTTWRREYDRRTVKHDRVDDVVMTNERGEVTETTRANLVVKMDGTWWTPPLDSGCMPGVYRRILVEAGSVKERAISVPELVDAEAVAVIDSVAGWRPAVFASDPWGSDAG